MPLLSRPLQLHDARDVEALIWKAIDTSPHVAGTSFHDREDLCAYLLGVVWELSLSYNPDRGRVTFTTFAYTTARLRIIDFQRSRNGRTRWQWSSHSYERNPRPAVVSLDGDDPERDRLVQAQQRGGLDGDSSGFADELRALDRRSSGPGRRQDSGCDETDGEAA
jgi:DNA-directed RNA polymerase specialized sigma24 family protein